MDQNIDQNEVVRLAQCLSKYAEDVRAISTQRFKDYWNKYQEAVNDENNHWEDNYPWDSKGVFDHYTKIAVIDPPEIIDIPPPVSTCP
jgi:hypothetical protein